MLQTSIQAHFYGSDLLLCYLMTIFETAKACLMIEIILTQTE
jgi:hypothetical protein